MQQHRQSFVNYVQKQVSNRVQTTTRCTLSWFKSMCHNLTHLMPVQHRTVDLFHRVWCKFVDKSVIKKNRKYLSFPKLPYVRHSDDPGSHGTVYCSAAYSHRMTPFFRPFWKSEPMGMPVTSSIQILSSSSFWRSYFCAIWLGREVKGHMCSTSSNKASRWAVKTVHAFRVHHRLLFLLPDEKWSLFPQWPPTLNW